MQSIIFSFWHELQIILSISYKKNWTIYDHVYHLFDKWPDSFDKIQRI
mgnify:CR=1